MEVNGLPLHPLVIHAAVVLGPAAAGAALLHVAVPRWRERSRWPMVVLAVLAVGAIVLAYITGTSFLNSRPDLAGSSAVQHHQARGQQLLWVTLGFGVVAVLDGWLADRPGATRVVLDVLLAVAAVALLVWVVLTGDAGARAVWG